MKVFYNIFHKKEYLYFFALFVIFFLAIFLRCNAFLSLRPLWHDECSLALSIIYKNTFDYFTSLLHSQSAPPLFMIISKFMTNIFGVSEFSLRLFPFICGILSVFTFYVFTKMFIKNKFVILFSNLLFALNFYVIYYSQEFKQYSTDVFFCLFLFILVNKINLKDLTYIKAILYSVLFSIFPFISIPTFFIITSYFIYELLKNKNYMQALLFFFIPFIAFICYMIFVLFPQKEILSSFIIWNNGYIDFNFKHLMIFLKNNFSYFFYPNKLILFKIILLFLGIYYLFKNINKKEYFLLTFLLLLIIFSSILHIYPVYQRLALYLIPFSTITMLLFIDIKFQNKNLFLKLISICLMILSFGYYFTPNSIKTLLNLPSIQNNDSRKLMEVLKEKYNLADYVAINSSSDSDFYFYAYLNEFNPKKILSIGIPKINDETNYINQLNKLPKGKYWFYYSYDNSNTPVIKYLEKWKIQKENKVLYELKVKNSLLLYLEH